MSDAPIPPLGPALKRLVVPIYLPWSMSMLGGGVLLPVLPLHLEAQGLSLTLIGTVTAAAGLGAALGGIPASALAQRWGNDRLLFGSLAAMAVTAAVLGVTNAAVALVILRIAWGLGTSGTTQSRQLYIARSVEASLRGRVMAGVGGTHRLTFVIGPLLGGFVFDRWGSDAAFLLAGAVTAIGLIWIVLPGGVDHHEQTASDDPQPPVSTVLWQYRRRLARASFGPLLVMSAREGRYVVVPLIAVRLGLSASEIGAVVAAGTVADFLLFPVSGYIMDRRGRLFAMVPAFSLMAFGLLLLGIADSATAVVVAGVVMGVGNGLSSGSMLTLSTDLAPADAPGPFIAGFHVISSAGMVVGPFVVGLVADSMSLGASAVVLAGMLTFGLLWIVFVIGETGAPALATSD